MTKIRLKPLALTIGSMLAVSLIMLVRERITLKPLMDADGRR